MPVVIHDFEVETAPEPPRANEQPTAAPPPPPPAQELELLLRRQAERAARIYAH